MDLPSPAGNPDQPPASLTPDAFRCSVDLYCHTRTTGQARPRRVNDASASGR